MDAVVTLSAPEYSPHPSVPFHEPANRRPTAFAVQQKAESLSVEAAVAQLVVAAAPLRALRPLSAATETVPVLPPKVVVQPEVVEVEIPKVLLLTDLLLGLLPAA